MSFEDFISKSILSICKHGNVDFISNVDSKAVDIWVRCAFKDDYNYMRSNLRKETGKEGSCRKVGRYSPKHGEGYFFDFWLTLFGHKFRWLHHGIFTFQMPFRVTINGGVLTFHRWTKNSHVLNFISGFSLYFTSLLRHIIITHWFLTNRSLSFLVNIWRQVSSERFYFFDIFISCLLSMIKILFLVWIVWSFWKELTLLKRENEYKFKMEWCAFELEVNI